MDAPASREVRACGDGRRAPTRTFEPRKISDGAKRPAQELWGKDPAKRWTMLPHLPVKRRISEGKEGSKVGRCSKVRANADQRRME